MGVPLWQEGGELACGSGFSLIQEAKSKKLGNGDLFQNETSVFHLENEAPIGTYTNMPPNGLPLFRTGLYGQIRWNEFGRARAAPLRGSPGMDFIHPEARDAFHGSGWMRAIHGAPALRSLRLSRSAPGGTVRPSGG